MDFKNTPQSVQTVELKPKLGAFLASYIVFSIPGFVTGLLWLMITVIVFFAVITGVVAGGQSDSQLKLKTDQQTSSTSNGLLIYDLQGAIDTGTAATPASSRTTGIYTELVKTDFAKIKNDNHIKNVVFRVNTPGGAVFAAEELGDLINDLIKSKGQNQVVYYYDQTVASGGLWATLKNDNNYIVGSNYGETGSIGVIMELPNVKGLADKIGYSQTVIKSAPSKDYGSPFRDLSPSEQSFLQKQVDDKYQQFINIVARGRKLSPDKVKEFANGYVYPNAQAKDYGLLDELGGIDIAVKKAASNANLGSNYNVWELAASSNPLDSFLATSSLGQVLGLSSKATQLVDQATFVKAGQVYALDETKF